MSRDLVITKRGRGPLNWGLSFAERSDPSISFDAWMGLLNSFSFQGVNYTLPGSSQEHIGGNLASNTRAAYKANGVVFACMGVRMRLFSEARFQFRQLRNGKPGDLFGTPALAPLENPWPGATTGDLLSRMIQYADLAGNAFVVRRPGPTLVPLRPDWVTIVAGTENDDDEASIWDPDVQLLGYVYQPGGPGSGEEPIPYRVDEVAHFAPNPDPESRYAGMSWLTPVVREVMADKAATDHKLKFFENGATPQMVVKLDVPDLEKFKKWIDVFKVEHEGASNAYKTLFLGAGADATVVGSDLKQLDFKITQGAGETRIAAAAGVPPVIVGLSEGLQAATYSNYGQARRALGDGTMRNLWRNAAGSLARITEVPERSELWYDSSDIAFLREDEADAATIQATKAQTIKALVDAGYESQSVIDAVVADDMRRLVHTGLFSVQLQPPGSQQQPPEPAPAQNGTNGSRREAVEALVALATAGREG